MSDYSNLHKRLIHRAGALWPIWVGAGGISLLRAASIIVMMYALSVAIDAVFMQHQPLDTISPMLLLLAAAMAFRGFLFVISEILAQRASSQMKRTLRDQLNQHIFNLGSVWTERQSSGDISATAVEGVEKLNAYFARFLPAAINMAVVPVILAVFVFLIDWISGLILFFTGPLIPVFMSLIGMKAKSETKKQWSTLRRMSGHFLDTVQGLRTLKLFQATENKQNEIEYISDRFRKSTMSVLKIAFLSALVLELFASIATALVAVEIGVRLIEGHIGFQLGLFVLLLAPEYYLPFRLFGAQHHAGMEGTEAAERVFDILDTPVDKESVLVTSPVPNEPLTIQFENVSFSYPDNPELTIKRCNFFLEPGITTALAGRSGSGKTTLMRLISRQITPDSGQILINGMPLNEISETQWLQSLAVVQQQTRLFNDTILANLRIARPDASINDVIDAAKRAEAHNFIKSLPNGYNTHTGERGARFSGGELQRLAIARAFLKKASVILLDEPSSALDPDSELKITVALKRLVKHKTVLVIAHRLSTLRNADCILVMERGRITNSGHHNELCKTNELYFNLVEGHRQHL